MTGDELKAARHQLGLSINDFAEIFGVANERTVRGWELGFRGDQPTTIPMPVQLLVQMALEMPEARRWLGIVDGR